MSLKTLIEVAEYNFKREQGGLKSPTTKTIKDLNTNKQLVLYIKSLIEYEIKNIVFAYNQYISMVTKFASGPKGTQLMFTDGGTVTNVVNKSDLIKFKRAILMKMRDLSKSLGSLIKRYRKYVSPEVAAVSGTNAMTYVDEAMVRYLSGTGLTQVSVLNYTFNQFAAVIPQLAGTVDLKSFKRTTAELINDFNVAVAAAATVGIDGNSTVGQLLDVMLSGTSADEVPPHISGNVLITIPHCIKYFRSLVLSENVTLSRQFHIGNNKYLRPYYLVTEEFNPIIDSIRELNGGATSDDAIAAAIAGRTVPSIISYNGNYYYSLTAVQQFNSPHTAKKALTRSKSDERKPGANGLTFGQVNDSILGDDQRVWSQKWGYINKDGDAGTLTQARTVLALYKAVYNILRSK